MSAATWSAGQQRKNDVLHGLAIVAVWFARLLPAFLLRGVGRSVGVCAFFFARGARRVAVSNVRRALGLTGLAAHLHVARTFVTLGAALGDTATLLDPRKRAARRLPLPEEARRVLCEALRDGEGAVVLVTAHHGLWEHLAAALVEEGFPLTTPVRRSYDPRLETLVHAPMRDARGVVTVDRDDPAAARVLLRALRARRGLVGFLVDLNVRGATIEAPFLGLPAWTTTAPARMARAARVPIVVACADPGGVRVERLLADTEDIEATTAAISSAVSQNILRAPHAWIWMHDRFAGRRESAPISAGESAG